LRSALYLCSFLALNSSSCQSIWLLAGDADLLDLELVWFSEKMAKSHWSLYYTLINFVYALFHNILALIGIDGNVKIYLWSAWIF
jgi:hypothetical protein